MTIHRIVLIPGDGIGPEVAAAVTRVLRSAEAPVEWEEQLAGVAALETVGEVLPQQTLDAVTNCGIALKGPCTTPVGEGFTSVNVQLRKRLELYVAVRPIRNLPNVPTRYEGVDLVVLRENTEGLYSGIENEVTAGVVTSLKVATEHASRRIARWGFQYARDRGRKKITVMHKANIMKLSDGMFLRCARAVREEFGYDDIEYEEMIIDAGCMKLVQDPTRFDVLLLENLYGDVLSDLCAGFVGGLGVVPGANIGNDSAVFEAVHGSAPDIAGKGVANPLALLMSAVMMLNHLADTQGDVRCREVGQRIKRAYNQALSDGQKTRDLGGDLGTEDFTSAVIDRLGV
ncbi:MAG: isocitrate/isopropylmalate dehydrogenase family protein [Myxococcales bacterium]|nr:isocitrate/isopropylmalate dehydrogenase family protein [Myxococcales bacterium]MDH3483654.1 isocitrate/isopropylmalate dehydrogenase family protein [Myxococcales bacterium]